MAEDLLRVEDLKAEVEGNKILKGVSLSIKENETHVLMGPNGAGKSTLGNVIMGNPVYHTTGGSIWFNGEDITQESADKRARRGMFLSFQNPLEVPGLSLDEFIRNAIRQKTGKPIKIFQFKKELAQAMELLDMDEAYAQRDLNAGFSGGEKKKAEILQLLMLKPSFAILDETDSGLDVDAVRTVSKGIEAYKREQGGSLLIITHSTKILEALDVDHTHIIVKGQIVKSGGRELIDQINEEGFEAYI
ncbi:MAG: Fe-S cluster assembly ATPase SufC [Lachnospiraceae bacterium]|nr:Fe-S cluster assembly ATPase SufC [Lachnospiraceae bacterium]